MGGVEFDSKTKNRSILQNQYVRKQQSKQLGRKNSYMHIKELRELDRKMIISIDFIIPWNPKYWFLEPRDL